MAMSRLDQLQFENDELRRRLEEAESIVRAISRNEVDAVVVQSGNEPHVLVMLRQAEAAARKRSEQVRGLAEVATQINFATEVAAVLQVITDEARRLIESHQSFTSLMNDSARSTPVTVISLSDKYKALSAGDARVDDWSLARAVCAGNAARRLTQVELEAHLSAHPEDARATAPMRGWLGAPLVGRDGRNIGLIQLSDRIGGEYTPDDEAVLVQLAQMASVALENARLVESLRNADRRKDEFLAMLAHELRNPLAPLRNMLEVMKQSAADELTQRRARETMERQLGQMVRLIDDLLDLSRITRDKLQLRKQRTDLNTVVQQSIEAARAMLECSRHQIRAELPAETIHVNADPARLAQIFGNLLNNACKYSEAPGDIRVALDRRNGAAQISIRDNGIGIPSDKLQSIFDMFSQIDTSLERAHGGLGIGLTLVKRLAEMHGGAVTAHSDGLGKGSEFVLKLPLVAEPAAAEPVASSPHKPEAGRSLRILVVDDNRDAAESLALLLKLRGHVTQLAFDGEQAVEQANAGNPHAILLDIGLPRLNGYDACRAIREQSRAQRPMIVALTGWGQDEDRRRTAEAGFDEHLVKPIGYDDLLALLSRIEQAGVAPESAS
jgi:signal transduction histidine kinase/ActR/RegA family two-component response regulator